MALDVEKLKSLNSGRNQPREHMILLVDDEQNILDAMSRMLRRDYNVLMASSGAEALEFLQSEESASRIALVISDQRMPGMTGLQFLEKAIPLIPHATRVILTGYTDASDLIDAINKAHIHQFLAKPLDSEELPSVVRRAVEDYERRRGEQQRIAELEQQIAELKARLEKGETG